MRKLNRKLRNERGATMMMALIALLAVVTVSSIALRTVTANAGRIRGAAEEEQAFLTVSSAAAALRDSLRGRCYSRCLRTVRTDVLTGGEVTEPGMEETVLHREWIGEGASNPGPLEALLQEMAEAVAAGRGTQQAELTVEVELPDAMLQPVAAELTMYSSGSAGAGAFSLRMDLQLLDGGAHDAWLTLELAAEAETLPDRSGEREYTDAEGISCREHVQEAERWTLRWSEGVISRRDAVEGRTEP